VLSYLDRARAAKVTWEVAQKTTEAELESLLFRNLAQVVNVERVPIDFDWIHEELRLKGVTLQLLWGEYQVAVEQAGREAYRNSQFCERARIWRGQRQLSSSNPNPSPTTVPSPVRDAAARSHPGMMPEHWQGLQQLPSDLLALETSASDGVSRPLWPQLHIRSWCVNRVSGTSRWTFCGAGSVCPAPLGFRR